MEEVNPVDRYATDEQPLLNENDMDSPDEVVAEEEVEEEDECRICRGPAEEGRPLYSPCKCSGSIGLAHQDCLTSWLAMTRGDGRCELCKTKFQFAPKYAENAPEHLPPYEVFLGLSRRAIAKWLPFCLRFAVAAALWLLLVPLATAYLYQGWMHRPSSISPRWKWELIPGDTVSGAVIACVIIVSFLSLMSFGDFLRNNFQDPDAELVRAARIDDAEDGHVADEALVIDEMVHDGERYVFDNESPARKRRSDPILQTARRRLEEDEEPTAAAAHRATDVPAVDGEHDEQEEEVPDDIAELERLLEQEAALDERLEGAANENEFEQGVDADEPNLNQDQNLADAFRMRQPRENQPPLRDQMNVDDADIDINIALDELLGLRGPLGALIRNLLWLLAFNTTYLGIFAFIPRTIGEAIHARCANSTLVTNFIEHIPFAHSKDEESFSILGEISDLNEESARVNSILQLPDISIIVLGYFTMAFMVLMCRIDLYLFRRFVRPPKEDDVPENADSLHDRPAEQQAVNVNNAVGERRARFEDDPAIHDDGGAQMNQEAFGDAENNQDEDLLALIGEKLALVVEGASAIVKIGVLLFLKMLLLPLLLGIWLDVSTLDLFERTLQDRILFAGRDLFSAVLLHWVVGITFMLLVTVSVLQLREVVHPDLLAPMIRPQEPQPDLLGNLLHEKGTTHAKRMLVSLAIYVALLMIHVWLPARLLVSTGIGSLLPFFRPKLWHIVMPQLQIPFELIVFHLCMLAFLEKNKNHIGGLQHQWLSFACRKLGLTDELLPQTVDKFVLLGSHPVFTEIKDESEEKYYETVTDERTSVGPTSQSERTLTIRKYRARVDPFWYDLAACKVEKLDILVESNIEKDSSTPPVYAPGRQKVNGVRVLSYPQTHIRLPSSDSSLEMKLKESSFGEDPIKTYLLPTTLGPYRLKKVIQVVDGKKQTVIQFWREVRGEPIPRPPEGWDDLGIGGAEIQGRWAWAHERKSVIENSVAARTPIFGRTKGRRLRPWLDVLKIVLLIVLSWFASSLLVCFALSGPLLVGRLIMLLFRVSDHYVHDPLAFVLGGCALFPVVSFLATDILDKTTDSVSQRTIRWVSAFRMPPIRKLLCVIEAAVLWFVFSPLCIGILYDLLLVKSRSWFALESPIASWTEAALSWGLGTVLLGCWALLCASGILTQGFWFELHLVMEGDDAVNRRLQEDRQRRQDGDELNRRNKQGDAASSWQGMNGRIATSYHMLKTAICNWEWEVINPYILLKKTAHPVAKQLAASCFIPICAYVIWLIALDSRHDGAAIRVPLVGVIDKGLYRMVVFRAFAALVLIVQLASSNDAALQAWFRAAHKAARDDRYLIGETLMNYQEPQRVD